MIKHTFVILAYKKSHLLEECVKSVMNQSIKTNAVIATSTPNSYITKIAKKYKLEIIINNGLKGIGNDFDFAIKAGNSELVTIAHQDDIYDYDYAKKIMKNYEKNKKLNPTIIFSDYYEIRNNVKIFSNLNLKIKRGLLFPLKFQKMGKFLCIKRFVLRFGNSISCPAVTFVTKNIKFPVFSSKYKCDVDWNAWEKLSKLKGAFIFVNEKLMGHRVHSDSTTTEIISNDIRTKEDYDILCRFWPKKIAKFVAKIYKNSEKSNKIKE